MSNTSEKVVKSLMVVKFKFKFETHLFSLFNLSVGNDDNLLLLLECHYFSETIWLRKERKKHITMRKQLA